MNSDGGTGELIFKFDREAKPFKRYKVAPEIHDLSFSIAVQDRKGKIGKELCLEAASKQEMMQFVNNLKTIAKDFPIKPEFEIKNIE